MALLQIAEPGQTAAPHQHRLAVGIDLGTTNSLVAAVRSGQATILNDEQDRSLVPSVVYYGENEKLVGTEAFAKAAIDPKNTIISVKRLIGRSLMMCNLVIQTCPMSLWQVKMGYHYWSRIKATKAQLKSLRIFYLV